MAKAIRFSFLSCAFLLGIAAFAPTTFAADGYKNIKFGISIDDLRKLHVCHVESGGKNDGMETFSCPDFSFNGTKSIAFFYFIDKGLRRIAIAAGQSTDDFMALLKPLSQKYGRPSTVPPNNQFSAFDAGAIDRLDIGWEHDTVTLRLFREGRTVLVMLLYSSADFDDLKIASKTKGIEKDL